MKVAFVYAEKKFDETFLRKKLYEALGLGLIPKKIFLTQWLYVNYCYGVALT